MYHTHGAKRRRRDVGEVDQVFLQIESIRGVRKEVPKIVIIDGIWKREELIEKLAKT